MPKPLDPPAPPPARPFWPVLIFLIGFTAGIVALAYYYLIPALQTFHQARESGDKTGAKAITATSALLLAVLLLILVAGILLTFRIGRLFFPRNTAPRAKTVYTDAWAESAKRMKTPPEE